MVNPANELARFVDEQQPGLEVPPSAEGLTWQRELVTLNYLGRLGCNPRATEPVVTLVHETYEAAQLPLLSGEDLAVQNIRATHNYTDTIHTVIADGITAAQVDWKGAVHFATWIIAKEAQERLDVHHSLLEKLHIKTQVPATPFDWEWHSPTIIAADLRDKTESDNLNSLGKRAEHAVRMEITDEEFVTNHLVFESLNAQIPVQKRRHSLLGKRTPLHLG